MDASALAIRASCLPASRPGRRSLSPCAPGVSGCAPFRVCQIGDVLPYTTAPFEIEYAGFAPAPELWLPRCHGAFPPRPRLSAVKPSVHDIYGSQASFRPQAQESSPFRGIPAFAVLYRQSTDEWRRPALPRPHAGVKPAVASRRGLRETFYGQADPRAGLEPAAVLHKAKPSTIDSTGVHVVQIPRSLRPHAIAAKNPIAPSAFAVSKRNSRIRAPPPRRLRRLRCPRSPRCPSSPTRRPCPRPVPRPSPWRSPRSRPSRSREPPA